ncbi:uncharacterized protein G2W53_018128 [Senna tora]|uniref:Uncharacterized protein n=1 Tax=Senna tora TaxID=362788 RepID=A0A834TZZ0_9FABA|nr:uncharacterized protein G2W53_018128 [Senna tora]
MAAECVDGLEYSVAEGHRSCLKTGVLLTAVLAVSVRRAFRGCEGGWVNQP